MAPTTVRPCGELDTLSITGSKRQQRASN